jgi:hypothetical protein
MFSHIYKAYNNVKKMSIVTLVTLGYEEKKRPAFTGPCPLRHAEHIVIWEGNYISDIYIVGKKGGIL